MEHTREYTESQVDALFASFSLCGMTIVLALTPALSSPTNRPDHISYSLLYGWEAIVFILAIVSILLVAYRKENSIFVETEVQTTASESVSNDSNSPWWVGIPLRSVFLTLTCLGSLVPPVFGIYRTSDNIGCFKNKSNELLTLLVLVLLKDITCVAFCLAQLLFLPRLRNKVISCRLLKLLLSTAVASNFSLCIDAIRSVFSISETVTLYNEMQGNATFSIPTETLTEQAVYLKCENSTAKPDKLHLYFYKYSYQFLIEFAVMSLCFLCPTFCALESTQYRQRYVTERNQPGSSNSRTTSISNAERTAAPFENESLRQPISVRIAHGLKKVTKASLIFLANHAFILTVIIAGGVFSAHLFTDICNNYIEPDAAALRYFSDNNTLETAWNSTIQTTYTYTMCIVAFIGWILARGEKTTNKRLSIADIILLVSAYGHLFLIFFETIDSLELFIGGTHKHKTTERALFFIKTIVHYVGLYSQVILLLKATKMKIYQARRKTKQLFIKGIIVFTGVCNAEKCIADNFFTPVTLSYAEAVDYQEVYGQINWWYITELLYPFVSVYRLISAMLCFEACVRFSFSRG